MVTIVKHIQGHYDVQEVEFGKVYRWCPERTVVDCTCGQRLIFNNTSTATCRRCGADHEASVREGSAAGQLGDENLHPWRYAEDQPNSGLPF